MNNVWFEDLEGQWRLYGSDRKYSRDEREGLVNLFPELGGLVISFEDAPYKKVKEVFKTPNDLQHGDN